MAWNLLSDCDHYRWHHVVKFAPHYILDMYENAREKPYIIHYAGFLKPEDFGYEFWKAARETPFYENFSMLPWSLMVTRPDRRTFYIC